jgi:hypothetical protein
VAADVDQDSVALTLAVQAGAARPEGDRDFAAASVSEHPRHALGVARLHDGLRDQAVGAGVGRVADQVGRAGEDRVLAEQSHQVGSQRLRRAGCDPVGRAVRR